MEAKKVTKRRPRRDTNTETPIIKVRIKFTVASFCKLCYKQVLVLT